MKYGMRTPNINKRISARTTGKVTRAMNKAVNPLYGKKGMGFVNDPSKAIYNKVYNTINYLFTYKIIFTHIYLFLPKCKLRILLYLLYVSL